MSLHDDVRAYRCERIREALVRHNGNRARAARELGVDVGYIYQAVHRFKFDIPGKIGRPAKGV